ncbi:SdiA-regulated domain-containing protein [Pontibacter sp. BT731]|uniref:SdiA-regulated domain-containing protein n=1 Tax=Pontibacter coccineus TaxID=3063328 RepID=UPI0026E25C6C|nr:SdiA-regulated domain-containing protein [Pontibacter sp. BT731]MDO6391832.1 SdiA-regulated domain-containing protein [Pontibacter sp. BT731]
MKHTYLWAMVLLAGTTLSSCDQIWSARNVPDAVKVKFVESYPTIKQVDWEQLDSLYEAEFKISGRERKALFREDGTLISYTEEIEEQYLPKTVVAQLQKEFNRYKIEEVHRVQEDNATSFVVELEKGTQDIWLRYNEAGKLLEKSANSAKVLKQSASLLPLTNTEATAEDLGMADTRWELPAELREVSGISLLPDGSMACVQDEEGKIFLYDLEQKAITREIPFAGPGDYEGIAIAGEDAYIVRSDGTLFEVAGFMGRKPEIQVYEASFPATINIEGLAYDEEQNQLLLAPKGHDPKLKMQKAIYAFSLDSKKFQAEPVINISLEQVEPPKKGKKQKSDYDVLQPSSLEKHPTNNSLYLLDAVNNRLYAMTKDGKLSRTLELDESQLRQAEGLTFDQEGGMYIASEGGKKGIGVILKYTKGIN